MARERPRRWEVRHGGVWRGGAWRGVVGRGVVGCGGAGRCAATSMRPGGVFHMGAARALKLFPSQMATHLEQINHAERHSRISARPPPCVPFPFYSPHPSLALFCSLSLSLCTQTFLCWRGSLECPGNIQNAKSRKSMKNSRWRPEAEPSAAGVAVIPLRQTALPAPVLFREGRAR